MPLVHFNWDENKNAAKNLLTDATGTVPFSDEILFNNARWYIQLRWIVIVVLVIFQISSFLFADFLLSVGISLQGYWSITVAVILCIANVFFLYLLLKKETKIVNSPFKLIWMQVLFDLVCLTVVIHYLGSLNTAAPFLFLFHIALACIFFTIRSSFFVTLICMILFSSCVFVEYSGIYHPASILTARQVYLNNDTLNIIVFNTVTINLLFFLVWFIISRLSQIIRIRETQLLKAEEETKTAYSEKDKYIVHMTHQLKSPLAAIGTNIALLTEGYCGEFPEEAREVLERIDKRSKLMGALILDVLKLEQVKSGKNEDLSKKTVNLGTVLDRCIKDLMSAASNRDITFKTTIKEPAHFLCVEEQIVLMFNNLLSNAVNYSHNGGVVKVVCPIRINPGFFTVSISDTGIGIKREKLPLIFDEYFRTKEATRHNERSTGIGLSIVKNIALNHNIKISADSTIGKGTTFFLTFSEVRKH